MILCCFRQVVATVPDEWVGGEVHLRWNSGSEALLFDEGGRPLQGFTGCPDHQKREDFVVSPSWPDGGPSQLVYYIEMACNDMFGAGKGCMIGKSPTNTIKNGKKSIVFRGMTTSVLVD